MFDVFWCFGNIAGREHGVRKLKVKDLDSVWVEILRQKMDDFSGTFRSRFISGACTLKPAHHPLIPSNEGARTHLKMLTGSIYASWLQRERHLHASRLHQSMLPARHQNSFGMRSKTDGHPRKKHIRNRQLVPQKVMSVGFFGVDFNCKVHRTARFEDFKVQVSNIKVQTLHLGPIVEVFFFWEVFLGEGLNPHFLFGAAAMVQNPAFI